MDLNEIMTEVSESETASGTLRDALKANFRRPGDRMAPRASWGGLTVFIMALVEPKRGGELAVVFIPGVSCKNSGASEDATVKTDIGYGAPGGVTVVPLADLHDVRPDLDEEFGGGSLWT